MFTPPKMHPFTLSFPPTSLQMHQTSHMGRIVCSRPFCTCAGRDVMPSTALAIQVWRWCIKHAATLKIYQMNWVSYEKSIVQSTLTGHLLAKKSEMRRIDDTARRSHGGRIVRPRNVPTRWGQAAAFSKALLSHNLLRPLWEQQQSCPLQKKPYSGTMFCRAIGKHCTRDAR